jgi:Microtubule-binding stalk of dynein motor
MCIKNLSEKHDLKSMNFSYLQQGTTLPGDVLLVTAFVSYVGCFTKQYRHDLVQKMWMPSLKTLEVIKFVSSKTI